MKICVAQTRSVAGNIPTNFEKHKRFIDTAVSYHANLIIFPELSLTNYEPTLAQALAVQPDDRQLDAFQTLADTGQITIGVGMATQNQPRPCISLVMFRPNQPRYTYRKQYLFPDEDPFFVPGPASTGLMGTNPSIALAICYELSVAQHAADAFKNNAKMYIASVAKTARGVDHAHRRLAEIASQYGMTVFMSNCVGMADSVECAGQSAVWNNKGSMLGQLDDKSEGVLLFDTETQESSAIAM